MGKRFSYLYSGIHVRSNKLFFYHTFIPNNPNEIVSKNCQISLTLHILIFIHSGLCFIKFASHRVKVNSIARKEGLVLCIYKFML